jgi:nucleoside-diphosphate-sugar epimerase
MATLAITGGTGFVGGHLLNLAVERGHAVRALTRRSQPVRPGVTWCPGALDDPDSLRNLAQGADAIIHVAGVINAPSRSGFAAGNITGTEDMLDAARAMGVSRFVHVSSLAAREPGLSDYGWSKHESEARVAGSGLRWSIVRPPAVYGPGDRETLELFRMAANGLVLLPPAGRMSVIEVGDLGRLLLALAFDRDSKGQVFEPDDGRAGGWSHRDFANALSHAVGRRARALPLPAWLIGCGAAIDTGRAWLTRSRPRLSFDRARYMCHPDWAVSATAQPPPTLWTPSVDTPAGLAATAAWYREEGWLRR